MSANQILNSLAARPSGNAMATHKEVKEIMLSTSGWMMARGNLYDIKAKSLGAGVYRVTLSSRY